MVLTAYFVLSPVIGFLVTVASGYGFVCTRSGRLNLRKLDTSAGVPGPHDFTVRISAVRQRTC
jgi:hypothetical protein